MYLQNKYTRWYYSIILASKNRNLESEIYSEVHHIIPRSLGGTDEIENLVRLTAREHFICHLLLTKMLEGTNKHKMSYAAFSMIHRKNSNQQIYKTNSRIYAFLKLQASIAHSQYKHTEETRQKISVANKGKVRSEEHSRNLSNSCKGRIAWNKGKQHSEETKIKIGKMSRKKTMTTEAREKIRKFSKGKTWRIINGKRTWIDNSPEV